MEDPETDYKLERSCRKMIKVCTHLPLVYEFLVFDGNIVYYRGTILLEFWLCEKFFSTDQVKSEDLLDWEFSEVFLKGNEMTSDLSENALGIGGCLSCARVRIVIDCDLSEVEPLLSEGWDIEEQTLKKNRFCPASHTRYGKGLRQEKETTQWKGFVTQLSMKGLRIFILSVFFFQLFCEDEDPSKIFSCLKKHKHDPQMERR